jgi:hypothetical protein
MIRAVIIGVVTYLLGLSLWAAGLAHASQGGMSEAMRFTLNGNRDLTIRRELRRERFCSTQIRCSGGICGLTCWTEPVRVNVIERWR